MPSFIFIAYALKKFQKFDTGTQKRILKKIEELKEDSDFRSVTSVHDMDPATHRLRIGDYRLILTRETENEFLVIDIDHRSKIYRG